LSPVLNPELVSVFNGRPAAVKEFHQAISWLTPKKQGK
jgi:hypothetical protein